MSRPWLRRCIYAIRQVTPPKVTDNPGGPCNVRPTLLLTRPEPQSARFAAEFRAAFAPDWPVVISPLMQTVWLGDLPDLSGIGHVIFSSETAVKAWCRQRARRDLVAWCVGPRTGQAARQAGFAVREGPGDARGLAWLIGAEQPGARMIWPHGQHIAEDIADLLKPAAIEPLSCVVYDQRPTPPTPEAAALLAGAVPVLLPLFSARSAQFFARQPIACPLFVALLSPAIAAPASAHQVLAAARPDSPSMLDALRRLAQLAGAG